MQLCRLLILSLIFTIGCGPSRPQAEIDRGLQAVTLALDNWKNNESAEKLKELPDPIAFTEELRRTHKLFDYTFADIDTSDPQVIRYRVTLKLADRKGKTTEREVVYAVDLQTPITIGRDPYY